MAIHPFPPLKGRRSQLNYGRAAARSGRELCALARTTFQACRRQATLFHGFGVRAAPTNLAPHSSVFAPSCALLLGPSAAWFWNIQWIGGTRRLRSWHH